jgi:predicted nucleic acid-binding protein
MKYLMDISALIAGVWKSHEAHEETAAWLQGKSLVICPLAALGFLRISTQPRGPFKASMPEARRLLAAFVEDRQAGFLPDDLPPLESHPEGSGQVTDAYLADLAQRHDFRLATLDSGINHPAVDLIPAGETRDPA